MSHTLSRRYIDAGPDLLWRRSRRRSVSWSLPAQRSLRSWRGTATAAQRSGHRRRIRATRDHRPLLSWRRASVRAMSEPAHLDCAWSGTTDQKRNTAAASVRGSKPQGGQPRPRRGRPRPHRRCGSAPRSRCSPIRHPREASAASSSTSGSSGSGSAGSRRLPRSPWKLGDGGPGVIVTQ